MSMSHEYGPAEAEPFTPPIDQPAHELTGRARMAVVLGLAGSLALGACSSEQSPAETAPNAAPSAATSAYENPASPDATPPVEPEPTQTADASAERTPAQQRKAIVRTALKYVWGLDDDGNRKTGYKNDYKQKARAYTGMSDAELAEPNNVRPETDCGLYVSMVMRESGADPHYPKRETNIQQEYLREHSDPDDPDRLYDRLKVDSVSDLQAGDIAMYSRTIEKYYDANGTHVPAKDKKRGHTYLVLKSAGADGTYDNAAGEVNGSDDNPAASASWKDYSPKAVDIYLTYNDRGQQPFTFYRLRPQ